MRIVKKISPKVVIGESIKEVLGTNRFVELMTVLGTVSEEITGEGGITGTYKGLAGNFEAVNMVTGEVFNSGILFLPQVAHDYLARLVRDSGEAAEFAGKLSVQSAKNTVGYEYTFEPLTEVQGASDRSAALEAIKRDALSGFEGVAENAKKGESQETFGFKGVAKKAKKGESQETS